MPISQAFQVRDISDWNGPRYREAGMSRTNFQNAVHTTARIILSEIYIKHFTRPRKEPYVEVLKVSQNL